MKTITLIAASTALASAMQAQLTAKFPDATFVHAPKLTAEMAGSEVALVGLPGYAPGGKKLKVYSFNTKIIDGATAERKAQQWETIRDPKATAEAVLAELGNFQEYQIIPDRAMTDTKTAIVDLKLALLDADTEEKKLEIYKSGFNLLAGLLS